MWDHLLPTSAAQHDKYYLSSQCWAIKNVFEYPLCTLYQTEMFKTKSGARTDYLEKEMWHIVFPTMLGNWRATLGEADYVTVE